MQQEPRIDFIPVQESHLYDRIPRRMSETMEEKDLIDSLPPPLKNQESLRALLQVSFLLTGVTFIASIGNFLFQIYMSRALSLGEFGALNTTLSLVMMLAVPLAA